MKSEIGNAAGMNSLTKEFNDLCLSKGHSLDDNAYRDRRAIYFEKSFKKTYGNSARLDNWQKLCGHLGIDIIPTSIKQCKKVSMSRA